MRSNIPLSSLFLSQFMLNFDKALQIPFMGAHFGDFMAGWQSSWLDIQ